MIQSMTGYGKAVTEFESKKIVVEIKALNGKSADITTKIAGVYRDKEPEIRNEILRKVERGKIDVALYVDNAEKHTATRINAAVIAAYYEQISELSRTLGIPKPENWFGMLLSLPDSLKAENQDITAEEWQAVRNTIDAALTEFEAFRTQEGAMLEKVFRTKIDNIANYLKQSKQYEQERIEKLRTRLTDNLKGISESMDFDKNRLEQELIYYIEKLDVNEETARLSNHLKYFIETMENEHAAGKKLGFIAQEMGREINTLGSKANHSEMQRLVVAMKDELEQIKEQVLNVL